MVREQVPRIVIGADVLLDSLIEASGSSADLVNIVLDGQAVPVIDSRIVAFYSATMGKDGLGLPASMVKDVMVKILRLSDYISPAPVPVNYRAGDLFPEDKLYFQLAFSAGIVPVVKKDLHFYLDSKLAQNIPMFTPEGLVKEIGAIKEIMRAF